MKLPTNLTRLNKLRGKLRTYSAAGWEDCRYHSDCGAARRCVDESCVSVCADTCEPDMACTVKEHVPYCHCRPGYEPTDIGGLACQRTAPVLPPGTCATDEDCESDRSCRNQTCVNPCEFRSCYHHRVCYAHRHQALCVDVYDPKEVEWVPALRGAAPLGSVAGGWDKDADVPLYVCRAKLYDLVLPGSFNPLTMLCSVPYNVREYSEREYEVLIGSGLQWVKSSGGQILPNAVAGGTSKGETLFICRQGHSGYTFIGKVHPSMRQCFIPQNGEIHYDEYEVLVHQ